ncbi:MAG: hypothetical protein HN976_35865, partial [Lentisphaerae bacterium]|nr:hypothetical protein [Lentisphaerota bacterium]
MHTGFRPFFRFTLMASVSCLFAGLCSLGAPPETIGYQGRLTDSQGNPVTGTLTLVFHIYTQEDNGTPHWTEEHPNVSVTQGEFRVGLGGIVPFAGALDFTEPYFLEIVVGGETLTPRIPLHATPYAMKAHAVTEGAVVTTMLADDAVDRTKIAENVAGEGLAQNADGSLRLASAGITAEMISDEAIADHHIAQNAAIGQAKIAGLSEALSAKIDRNAPVPPNTATKITYDENGLVIAGEALLPADIPTLDAAKIATGTFSVTQIPGLDAAQVVSGMFDAARISEASVTQHQTALAIDSAQITGLGMLATLSGIGSDEITDLSIVDADISA